MYLDIPRQLEGGAWGALWDGLLSRCTWLGVTKNVFFNNFVVNKGSGNVSYVQVSGIVYTRVDNISIQYLLV